MTSVAPRHRHEPEDARADASPTGGVLEENDVFRFAPPIDGPSPLIVEVPHAGLGVPESLGLRATREARLRDADLYVDELYADAPSRGASLLSAKLSRYVVDLNRGPDDVDAATVPEHPAPRASQPRGVVWRMGTDGRPVLERPLTMDELDARLDAYYRPYHARLTQAIDEARARFGQAVVIAGHSMPSVGRSVRGGPGIPRADIVPGTRGRTSADRALIALVDGHFRRAGLRVEHDRPYRGGFTTGHYGRPREGVHVIQIELSRALYLDERDHGPHAEGFAALRVTLADLVGLLSDHLRAR